MHLKSSEQERETARRVQLLDKDKRSRAIEILNLCLQFKGVTRGGLALQPQSSQPNLYSAPIRTCWTCRSTAANCQGCGSTLSFSSWSSVVASTAVRASRAETVEGVSTVGVGLAPGADVVTITATLSRAHTCVRVHAHRPVVSSHLSVPSQSRVDSCVLKGLAVTKSKL